ncbi:MAG: prepilin-type N-terminal cleavage/methylation domain-containing protein [Planctomycetes bacterium]|nr:prepilin-type N-terminal cleavage/methylation domain-containing protein [Planctomycetota bacterium]
MNNEATHPGPSRARPQPRPVGRHAARGHRRRAAHRRGFTLIELVVAGLIIAMLLGAVTLSLHQLGAVKSLSARHLTACLRADAALAALRREIVSVLRADDLFFTRLQVTDRAGPSTLGLLDRDSILLFNTRLRPVRELDFIGEGMAYETQFRIEEDEAGPVLWQRRDPVPDEYPLGGGVATPLVEGIIAVSIEAYDGFQWFEEWDSDTDGLPWALKVMVVASGYLPGTDAYDAPTAVLRTVIAIDRVPPSADQLADEEAGAGGADSDAGGTAGPGGGPGSSDGGTAPGFPGGSQPPPAAGGRGEPAPKVPPRPGRGATLQQDR